MIGSCEGARPADRVRSESERRASTPLLQAQPKRSRVDAEPPADVPEYRRSHTLVLVVNSDGNKMLFVIHNTAKVVDLEGLALVSDRRIVERDVFAAEVAISRCRSSSNVGIGANG